jgi:hypothetical protein
MAKAQEFELKPWPPDVGKSGRLIRTPAQGGAAGLIRTPRCGAYIEVLVSGLFRSPGAPN